MIQDYLLSDEGQPGESLCIVIDYDTAFVKDPFVFSFMVQIMALRGHVTYFVTDKTDKEAENKVPGKIYYAKGMSKRDFMARMGYKPHIWIE